MAKRNRKRLRNGRGAVVTIALLLFSSAIVRVATGAGEAVAQAMVQNDGERIETGMSDGMPGDLAPAGAGKSDMTRAEVGELLTALRDREARIKAREEQIDMRRRALEVADAEITQRLATLEEAETNLRRTLALANGAAENDLARLTEVYETMKPKDAAALFAAMEPDFAAGFIGRMRPDAAAAVIAGLPPDIAYSISVILAGRNAKAPKS